MRGLGSDGLTVGYLLLQYSVNVLLSLSICFIAFLYIDFYLLGDDASISKEYFV